MFFDFNKHYNEKSSEYLLKIWDINSDEIIKQRVDRLDKLIAITTNELKNVEWWKHDWHVNYTSVSNELEMFKHDRDRWVLFKDHVSNVLKSRGFILNKDGKTWEIGTAFLRME